MNTRIRSIATVAASATTALMLAACAPSMTKPDGAQSARDKLNELQADSRLAPLVPVAIKDADSAVRAAEVPTRDRELGQHLVLIADRKVDIAWSQAKSRYAEDQRQALNEQREKARLDARTREADNAHRDASIARSDARDARDETEVARKQSEFARIDADIARSETDTARGETEIANADSMAARQQADSARMDADLARGDANMASLDSARANAQTASARADAAVARDETDAARRDTASERQRADELQRQLSELNARETDRGLVVTLGDVLFATGRAELNGGVPSNLGKLAIFLDAHADRTVMIEGHTDNVGDDGANQDLSLRRARAVEAFLVAHGVSANRLVASGKGESQPVASNTSDTGRTQNRRVEVIISHSAIAGS